MMLPVLYNISALTSLIVNLLLQNLSLNPNIRTIVIYKDNEVSGDFVNSILDQMSDFNKPLIVIDHNRSSEITSLTIGNEVVHIFLWMYVRDDLWSINLDKIQNSETVFYVFERSQKMEDMQTLSQRLWTSSTRKIFGSILIFFDVANGQPKITTFNPFTNQFRQNFTQVVFKKLYGEITNARRINLHDYKVSVLLALRAPTVIQIAANQFGGRDGKMAAFLAEYYNATFSYIKQAELAVLVMHQEGNRNVSQYVPADSVNEDDVFVVDDEIAPTRLNVSTDLMMNAQLCCDFAKNYRNFYPHEFDNYVAIVPSASINRHLRHIFHPTVYAYDFYGFLIFSGLWIVFKFLLYNKREEVDFVYIFFEVLGIVLQTKSTRGSRFNSERILLSSFLVFTTIMSIIEAAIIYDEMIKTVEPVEINTLKQLADSEHQIMITPEARIFMEFGNVSDRLQKKFVLTNGNDIVYNILAKNVTQGYVLRKSRAESLLQRHSLYQNGDCVFHIVKESLLELAAVTSGKPYFDDISARNVTTVVEDTAILKCRVKNKGDRTVSWMRKRDLHILTSNIYTYTGDQRFSIVHQQDSDDYDLKIEYAQLRDSGIYECQVNTEPKINLAVHLEVTEYGGKQHSKNLSSQMGNSKAARAKILGQLEVYVKRGSTISLACAVNIHASSIVWYHGQQVVDFDSVRGGISLETEKTDGGTTSRLLLTRAQLRDSGNYTCVPTGAVSASVQVHVLNGEHPAAMQTSNGVPCPSHTALLIFCLLTLYNSRLNYYNNSLFQAISHMITFPITSTGRAFSR